MYRFCIIKDFPMYEYSIETDKYEFCHNPFSMPKGELDSLSTLDIKNIVAYQYDFVCDRVEMASGDIRNHDIEIMKKVFLVGYLEDVIKEKFVSLYEAFQYGAPPHGGIALGIDRMLMMLKDTSSIRKTVAFPLSSSGIDMMTMAPGDVSEKQFRETHIKIR